MSQGTAARSPLARRHGATAPPTSLAQRPRQRSRTEGTDNLVQACA